MMKVVSDKHTIWRGDPANPEKVPPGTAFDVSAKEGAAFIAAGITRAAEAATPPAQAIPAPKKKARVKKAK